LRMVGRTEEARPYLEKARRHEDVWALVARAATAEGERDPKLPRQLGIACAAVGRNQEARAWLKLAIKGDPLDDLSQQTLFELEHGASARSATDAGQRQGSDPAARTGLSIGTDCPNRASELKPASSGSFASQSAIAR
jgi:hypothetical protein